MSPIIKDALSDSLRSYVSSTDKVEYELKEKLDSGDFELHGTVHKMILDGIEFQRQQQDIISGWLKRLDVK